MALATAGPVTLRPPAGTLLQGRVPVSLLGELYGSAFCFPAFHRLSNKYVLHHLPRCFKYLLHDTPPHQPNRQELASSYFCIPSTCKGGKRNSLWGQKCLQWSQDRNLVLGCPRLHAVAQSQLRQKCPCPWAPLPVSLQRSLCFGGRRVSGEVRRSGARATCRWQTSRSRHLPLLPSQEDTPCGGQDQRHRRPKPQHHAEIQWLRGHLGVWKTRQQMPGQRAHPTPSDKSSQ